MVCLFIYIRDNVSGVSCLKHCIISFKALRHRLPLFDELTFFSRCTKTYILTIDDFFIRAILSSVAYMVFVMPNLTFITKKNWLSIWKM